MNYIPTIGDLLVRPKTLGFISHVGVVVAPNTVLQNTRAKGEHLATVQEFAAGEPVTVHRTGVAPANLVARTGKVLANAQSYNPFSRNCEHTVSEVLHGIAKSPQLMFYAALVVVGVVLAILLIRR